jgi:hypothetical protein
MKVTCQVFADRNWIAWALNVADHDFLEIGSSCFCLFCEEISCKTVKTFTTNEAQVERFCFLNIFVWGITPDYSTNGGRVIDTMYLEEKGKK